jgi:hypothetical protein
VSTRTGSCSGTSPVSIPSAGLVDRFDEGVELLDGREIGIIPRLGEDLRGSPQPTPLRTDARQVAGATLLGIPTPAAVHLTQHFDAEVTAETADFSVEEERRDVEAGYRYEYELGGYAMVQATRPQLIAYGAARVRRTGPPVGSTAYPTEQDHHRASGAAH